MSTFNKLFTGSVLAATLLVLAHTGSWAWRSAQAIDAAQALAVAPVMAPVLAMASNGNVALTSTSSVDSCAKGAHADAR